MLQNCSYAFAVSLFVGFVLAHLENGSAQLLSAHKRSVQEAHITPIWHISPGQHLKPIRHQGNRVVGLGHIYQVNLLLDYIQVYESLLVEVDEIVEQRRVDFVVLGC